VCLPGLGRGGGGGGSPRLYSGRQEGYTEAGAPRAPHAWAFSAVQTPPSRQVCRGAQAYLGGLREGTESSPEGVQGLQWCWGSAGCCRGFSVGREGKLRPTPRPPICPHQLPDLLSPLTGVLRPPRARLPGRSGLRPSAVRYRGGGVLLVRWLGEKRGCPRPGEEIPMCHLMTLEVWVTRPARWCQSHLHCAQSPAL
jgi:hypothetical protein